MVLADFPIILWFRSGQRTWDRSPFALFSDDHKFLCILNEICLTCSVVQCLWKCTFTVQRSLVLLFCHYHVISRLLLLNRISFPFPTQSLSEIPVPKGDRAVHGFPRRWMPKTFICYTTILSLTILHNAVMFNYLLRYRARESAASPFPPYKLFNRQLSRIYVWYRLEFQVDRQKIV